MLTVYRGQHFAGVEDVVRVQQSLDAPHQPDERQALGHVQELRLHHTDAVLRRDGPSARGDPIVHKGFNGSEHRRARLEDPWWRYTHVHVHVHVHACGEHVHACGDMGMWGCT